MRELSERRGVELVCLCYYLFLQVPPPVRSWEVHMLLYQGHVKDPIEKIQLLVQL